jgi:hypothetical protein
MILLFLDDIPIVFYRVIFYVYLTHKAAILYNINANDLQNGGE